MDDIPLHMRQPRCPVCGEPLREVESRQGFHRFHFSTHHAYRQPRCTPEELARRFEDIADGEEGEVARTLRVCAMLVRVNLIDVRPAKERQVDERQEALDLG